MKSVKQIFNIRSVLQFIKNHLLLIVFCTVIVGITIVNALTDEREFSDIENRYLQRRPKFTVSSFKSGDFTSKYQEFVNDQFIFRDKWIDIKMLAEVMIRKIENNGVVFGRDNYMFDKSQTLESEKLSRNLNFISKFISKVKTPIYFSLVPSSFEVLKDKVPTGLNNIDQQYLINNSYNKLNAVGNENLTTCDMLSALQPHKDEYIYYKTDHHWTSSGAYIAYCSLAEHMLYNPVDISLLQRHSISNFYGTYYSRAKLSWIKPDTLDYYDQPISSMTVNNQRFSSLYDNIKFNERDKYAGFLRGNNGISIINTSHVNDPKLLVIKDSYANSMIPFLTNNYSQICVVDLRALKGNIYDVISSHDVDQILILYSFMNFSTDMNIGKLSV